MEIFDRDSVLVGLDTLVGVHKQFQKNLVFQFFLGRSMVKGYQCSDLKLEAEIVLGYQTLWCHFKEDYSWYLLP